MYIQNTPAVESHLTGCAPGDKGSSCRNRYVEILMAWSDWRAIVGKAPAPLDVADERRTLGLDAATRGACPAYVVRYDQSYHLELVKQAYSLVF